MVVGMQSGAKARLLIATLPPRVTAQVMAASEKAVGLIQFVAQNLAPGFRGRPARAVAVR